MEFDAVSNDVVAVVVNGSVSGEEIRAAVHSALNKAGYPQWRDIEAETYTYGANVLIIARPVPPLTHRVKDVPRLRRS